MKITEHFTTEEFERSSTASRKGINNKIPSNLLPSVRNLCQQVLEPFRAKIGQPVVLSSGYRCKALNTAIGGVATSQHMKGEAADIRVSDQSKLKEWFNILKQGEFDQLIMERETKTSTWYWIHVSCKPDVTKNRHQVINELVKYK